MSASAIDRQQTEHRLEKPMPQQEPNQPTKMPDLTPAAGRLADLLTKVHDEDLRLQTPCPKYALGDLIEHIGGLAVAFTGAATKSGAASSEGSGPPPEGDASRLPPDWQTRIPADLASLASSWTEPSAWTGMTSAGGVEMPGEVGGLVALNELIVHGWDVAKTIGQPYECDEASVQACCELVQQFSGPESEEARGDAFGPVVEVLDDAPLLDRLVALSGRDPSWPN
jgi:uncharacterized protein (TIGR03086 family)